MSAATSRRSAPRSRAMCAGSRCSDFQLVKAGDLLVEIDDEDYQARVAQAEADLLGADAAIENLKARKAAAACGDRPGRKRRSPRPRPMSTAPSWRLTRQRTLLATTYGTAQKVEQAVADEKRFEATLARNQAELEGAAPCRWRCSIPQESQLRAEAKAKQALLDLAKINLGYTRIVAPVDGMVGRARRARRAICPCRDPGHLRGAAEQCLGGRELQGNPAHPCRDRPEGRDHASTPSPESVIGAASTASRRRAARSSACCRRTTPPAISPRSCSASRSRSLLDPDNPLAGQLRPGMSVGRDDPHRQHTGEAVTGRQV